MGSTGSLLHFLLLGMRASSPRGMQKFHSTYCPVFRGQLSIQLAMPMPYRALSVFSLVTCVVLISFLIFGRYTRHEQAPGELVPSAGLLAITATSTGTVVRALVHEG